MMFYDPQWKIIHIKASEIAREFGIHRTTVGDHIKSLGIIAGGGEVIAWKMFMNRHGSCVGCLGAGIMYAKKGMFSAISDQSRHYCLCDPSRVGGIGEEALLKKVAPLEKRMRYCQYRSRFYSNAEEKNILINDNKTGGSDWGGPEAERLVLQLGDNIDESIKTYESLLVYFYTLWCKHCKKLKPVYGAAAVRMKEENVSGHLAAIDLTKRMDVADKFNIVSVPTMCYFKRGQFMKVYDGKRTTEDIVNFMKSPPEKPSVLSKIDI